MQDEEFMKRAIRLADKGRGFTNPNPVVGAVIVKDGQIIGEGYHERCGQLHAERNALAACRQSPEGATLYVTLEPCCHYGKTPPCTDAILKAGIRRVVIGSRDPNPKVCGKGAALLRQAGVIVEEDFLRSECDALNPVFFHYIRTHLPYVALKYAMTADGKIATQTGKSRWVTGEEARKHVHRLRHYYSGILIGIGTVLSDDPMLTCRIEGLTSPTRIIVDSFLRIPLESRLCKTAWETPLIVACSHGNQEKKEALMAIGARVLTLPGENNQVDMKALFAELGRLEIDCVLVEGGAKVNASVIRTGFVKKCYVYVGGEVFGGENAPGPVGARGVDSPADALKLKNPEVTVFGNDVLVEYEV